jgi:hypothetical protein
MLNKGVGGSNGGPLKVSSTGKAQQNSVKHYIVLASAQLKFETVFFFPLCFLA